MPTANEFRLNTDDTILIIGALLATGTNLVRDPEQGAAYAGDPEEFIKLADRIASSFVDAAMAIIREDESQAPAAYRDCYDVAATMAAGIEAYESYAGPCKFDAQTTTLDRGDMN